MSEATLRVFMFAEDGYRGVLNADSLRTNDALRLFSECALLLLVVKARAGGLLTARVG